MPQSHQRFHPVPSRDIAGELYSETHLAPPIFTLLQINGAPSGRCEQPLMPRSHQRF